MAQTRNGTAETEAPVVLYTEIMKATGNVSKGGNPIYNPLTGRGVYYLRSDADAPPFIRVTASAVSEKDAEMAVRQMMGLPA
jgi:hypothetical protein